jgi:hypothetical protein
MAGLPTDEWTAEPPGRNPCLVTHDLLCSHLRCSPASWAARDFFCLVPSLALTSDLIRGLVIAQAHVDRVAQEIVGRPSQIGDLGDQLWLDPMNARKNKRRAETSLAWRQRPCG